MPINRLNGAAWGLGRKHWYQITRASSANASARREAGGTEVEEAPTEVLSEGVPGNDDRPMRRFIFGLGWTWCSCWRRCDNRGGDCGRGDEDRLATAVYARGTSFMD
jgi:hypothetical protein